MSFAFNVISSFSLILVLLLGSTKYVSSAVAGTCASKCGPPSLQFTPGQRIQVHVINLTMSLVQLQKVYGTDPVPLSPGQEFVLNQGDGTTPNISLVFWDAIGLPLKTSIAKPDAQTLRIEIYPGGRPPGDRSVYVLSDGHVTVF
jgi:hypothetical protein